MAITYFDTLVNWFVAHGPPEAGEVYTRLPDGTGDKVTLGAVFYFSDTTYIFAEMTGDINPGWESPVNVLWYHDPWGAPSRNIKSDTTTRDKAEYHFYVTDSDSNPLEGVSGLGSDLGGGNYRSRETKPVTKTFTPVKAGYEFDSIPFTDESRSAYVTVTEIPPRQVILSSPADTDTGITLHPLLQWSISEGGAEAGDLLDIYLRKDDANFTDDDLLAGLVDATANSSLQIVGGLEYNSTYFWQVQAFFSVDGELLSSDVYSFTTIVFGPPTVSIDGGGNPTGLNNMVTLQRLIVAADNKVFYET